MTRQDFRVGQLTALRMGPWKWHFATKEDYYDNMTGRNYPMVFNIRMDPYESYDAIDSYGHLLQKVSWMLAPMNEIIGGFLQSLDEHPPVQGGKGRRSAHRTLFVYRPDVVPYVLKGSRATREVEA